MSAERCPACRSRLAPEPACPRCGCDLTLVRRAAGQSRQLLSHAVLAWAAGDQAEAAALARASLRLKQDPLTVAVLRVLGVQTESR